ncbi:transcriptional regulator [Nocardioides phosphati]|uniref:Transcriptional regulator n=1 Tax=Nocardioides phosphati TaxID=1867775 RepID=A0ABQ2NB29_9ACTN|nr:helix-turn-helix domain-containing protein [Nocardioides phosphati]GGO90595.1 transcriptional regulator [Nocardioides phosphati]
MVLTLGGEPLHVQLSRDLDAIVRSVVESVADLAPTYAWLPREQVLHEFAAIVATTTRAFIEVVRTGEMPSAEELEPMAAAAGLRAEEGFPLSDILTAYHVGISLVFDDVVPRAGADDQETLNQVYKLLLGFLARVMEAASRGWLAASSETLREAHGARQALLDAVLGGDEARATAERVGLRLPPAYGVMALRIGAHPDEVTEGVDPAVAARRKLRRLRHALEIAQPEALASMTATTATVLVPSSATLQHPEPERIVQDMARAAGAPILAAYEAAPVAGVGEALELATDVLDVAAGLGWTTGVVRLQDVAVAYQLTRPSAATSRLAELLAPLAEQPDLLATLDALAAERLNRRRTAKALNVHVNTVNYRLNRVRDLTGLDLVDPVDTQTLLAALAARRAAQAERVTR